MSTERKKKCQILIDGYIKNASKKYDLVMPSEIVTLIFMFHFIKVFDIEHGKKIKSEDNIIANIDESSYAFMNVSVIDEWMVPDCDSGHIHTIKVKIIKLVGCILIGIVPEPYRLDNSILACKGYCIISDGGCYHAFTREETIIEEYSTGDVVSLTFDLKSLSLSYQITKNTDGKTKTGIVFGSEKINKTKYKWAIGLFQCNDSVEIIDIYSKTERN